MNSSIFNKTKLYCQQCGIADIETFIDRCNILRDLLISENAKYNLTRISSSDDFWNKHIADSLSIALIYPELRSSALAVMDVGCGAGFPSLVLGIAFPQLSITAVDSIQKKTNFVKLAADRLRLTDFDVIWGRARELKIDKKYDFITARAVAEPIKIFKETRKFLADNGKIVIFKTSQTDFSVIDTLDKLTSKQKISWFKSEETLLPGGEKRIFLHAQKTNKA